MDIKIVVNDKPTTNFIRDGEIYTKYGKKVKKSKRIAIEYEDGKRSTIIYSKINLKTGEYAIKHNIKEIIAKLKAEGVEYKEIHDGLYYVFKDGRVFSRKKGDFLKPQKIKSGYLLYSIKSKMVYAHRLVWETFKKELEKGNRKTNGHKYEINHIDFNKANNKLENLELVSRNDNMKHARTMFKKLNIKRKNSPKKVKKVYKIIQKNYLGEVLNVFNSVDEAVDFLNIKKQTLLSKIQNGSQWDKKSFAIKNPNGTYTLYNIDKTYKVVDKKTYKELKSEYKTLKRFPSTYYDCRYEYGEKHTIFLKK